MAETGSTDLGSRREDGGAGAAGEGKVECVGSEGRDTRYAQCGGAVQLAGDGEGCRECSRGIGAGRVDRREGVLKGCEAE